jgi:HTH-type transcriptional regulator / antitoxin HipB
MKNKLKTYSLNDIKDEFIGKLGSEKRTQYEYELRMDLLGEMIKKARLEKNMTQAELGLLVGVQKSQISKLENSTNSATIETVVKVFKALKAEISFNVKLENQHIRLT